MRKHFRVDFTVVRSLTQSVTVEADSPADAIQAIRDSAATYGNMAALAGCTDVMIHACEQRTQLHEVTS